MKTKFYIQILLSIGISFSFFCQFSMSDELHDSSANAMTDTVNHIKRIDPSLFASELVPDKVVNGLKKNGCKIPQAENIQELHNIISGEFAKKGQKDWAALCSKNNKSSILIFWGGPNFCSSKIATSLDEEWVRFPYESNTGTPMNSDVGKSELQGFLRKITVAPVQLLAQTPGMGSPIDDDTDYRIIDHDAIEDGMTIDADYTHEFNYCMNGKWKKWGDRNSD